ncbi:MAG: D-glycero-beta-D-manno-heptose 1,7-bisphosphate 7-phosphatase [Chloroflexales bacterium]|nr:D-glycero-beta-D-manno-heptose 1,7-bisphosphate 7-phosphatase [Chloroflexales bacterium]
MRNVFLDRDGVINENRDDHVKSWGEFRFLPGALDALRLLTAHRFRIFVVTNQASVNRGMVSTATVDDIHRRMFRAAARRGAVITAVRYCPHRPDERCACRKPEPGMLLELAREHHVPVASTYMVGDALSDIAAGRAAGCQTILVRTGRGAGQIATSLGVTSMPDLVADDLLAAARWLCGVEHEQHADHSRGEPLTVYSRPARAVAEERVFPC